MRRKPIRRILASLTAAVLLCPALSGCSAPDGTPLAPASGKSERVNLVYYTIGEPDEDLELVNQELNRILLEKYGFSVEYHKIGWNDYIAQLNSLINTNQKYDIAFAWTDIYVTNAVDGNWLDLTPYLETVGADMYRAVNSELWKGVTIDGKIWGIPTNKELATPVHFLFSQELVEKYQIDISRYHTFSSLEPLLEMISEKEPDYIPLFFDSSHLNILSLGNYEYVAYDSIPLMVNSHDPGCQVVNIFETNYARNILQTLHQYYLAGYINQDASMRTSFSRFQGENVFLRLSSGGPDASASYSTDYGYPIIAEQVSDSIVTTESAQGGIMVVNANTAHPEECLVFLNAVNTDPEIRNLLNYGIEGVHYTLTEDDQVQIVSSAYRGVPYTQGNWFILKTAVGEALNKWELYEEFNNNTAESPLLGFTPDYSDYDAEFKAVSRVYEKYYTALMTGTVDPAIYLPQFLAELEDAGIDTLQAALQAQIDSWLQARKNS